MLNILYISNPLKQLRLISLMFIVLLVNDSVYAQEIPAKFTPEKIFSGHSEGNGWLRLFFGQRQFFHVDSHGFQQSDGSFRLEQTITFQGEAPKQRFWILKTTAPNQYKGTLSDASGRVTGSTKGTRLKLRYRIKGPLFMQQTLLLMADGQSIDNIGKITLLGIPIGSLHETIIMKN